MSKAMVNRIRNAIILRRALLGRATTFWRDHNNSKELRKEAARIALRSRSAISTLLHYEQQFSRPTLPRPPFTYGVELGFSVSKIDRKILRWEK